jgi:hypothetical protein
MTGAGDLLLDDYLRRLGDAARRLPPWQRELFLTEIADRIDAELSAGEDADLDQMRGLLARLGDPEDLVLAGPPVPDWPAGQELATVLIVLAGSVLLPVIGWLIGVTMLWASPRWRLIDKLLGTLVWPGGLGGLAWITVHGFLGEFGPSGPSLAFVQSGGLHTLVLPALIAALPPVLVAIRLLHTARRPAVRGRGRIAPRLTRPDWPRPAVSR